MGKVLIMRTILLYLPLFFSCFIGFSQAEIPNAQFEEWIDNGGNPPFQYDEPEGWTTTNSMTEFISAAVKPTSTPGAANSYSLRLYSLNLFGGAWYSSIRNGTATKNMNTNAPDFTPLSGGNAITGQTPIALTGEYIFDKTEIDQGFGVFLLKGFNPATQQSDTVIWGSINFTPTSHFSPFEIVLDHAVNTNLSPDSFIIQFYSSHPNNPVAQANFSEPGLIIDNLEIVSDTSAQQPSSIIEAKQPEVKIFPSPFTDYLMIEAPSIETFSLSIYNLAGQEMGRLKGSRVINLDAIPSGVYVVQLQNRNGETIYRKKLLKK